MQSGESRLQNDFREAAAALTAPALANIAAIVGCDAAGELTEGGRRAQDSRGKWRGMCRGSRPDKEGTMSAHEELVAIGRRWGRHVSEPWRLMFLTGAYIYISIVLAAPLLRCLLRLALALAQVQYTACWYGVGAFTFGSGLGGGEASCPALPVILGTLVTCADSARRTGSSALFFYTLPIPIHAPPFAKSAPFSLELIFVSFFRCLQVLKHEKVRHAVTLFLNGDLFSALIEFISNAHGSFGLHAIAATDPHVVCIAAKGQVPTESALALKPSQLQKKHIIS